MLTTVQVNHNVVISEDGRTALNVLTGELHYIPIEQSRRLLELRKGVGELQPSDFILLQIGVLRFAYHAEIERNQLREAIHDYLAGSGALCIMPTEKCNFRCTYCYETFEKGRMSPPIIEGVIQFLHKNTPHFESYSLGWFGGEPLLQTEIIVHISDVFRQLQRQHGFKGSIAITTNGSLLTEENLNRLNSVGIDLYHISVDGPQEIHNSQRIAPSGRNTYNLILDNIERMLETSDSHVILRTNLKAANPQMGEIVSNWLSSEIMPRFARFEDRIRYHVVSIWDASTSSVEGICISDSQKFQTWFNVKQHLAKAVDKTVSAVLAEEASGLGSLACYAGKPNHYIVGSDGNVYKCTVAFDLPENRIGSINSSGEMTLDSDKEGIWINANSLTDPSCSKCAFGTSCMGIHCPLTRIQTGMPPCPTEKQFIASYLAAARTGIPSPHH